MRKFQKKLFEEGNIKWLGGSVSFYELYLFLVLFGAREIGMEGEEVRKPEEQNGKASGESSEKAREMELLNKNSSATSAGTSEPQVKTANMVEKVNNKNKQEVNEWMTPQKRGPGRPSKQKLNQLKSSKSMLRNYLKGQTSREKNGNASISSEGRSTNGANVLKDLQKEVFEKMLNEWWSEKVEGEFEEIKGQISELRDMFIRDEAVESALVKAREREKEYQKEIESLKEELAMMSARVREQGILRNTVDVTQDFREPIIVTSRDISNDKEECEDDNNNDTVDTNIEVSDLKVLNKDAMGVKVLSMLSSSELEWEIKERKSRKNCIMVKGFCSRGKHLGEQIRSVLFDLTGVNIEIKNLRHVAGGSLITLDSWRTKRRLMENKYKLRNTRITIEDDLTWREQEIQNRIREEVMLASEVGAVSKFSYMKWTINDREFTWNEEKGVVEGFRNQEGRHF